MFGWLKKNTARSRASARIIKFPGRRMFAGAKRDRLTADFNGTTLSADAELKTSLVRLRARSRQLWMDNDHARKFYQMLRTNVVGPDGIRLQARTQKDDGTMDTADNARLEAAWEEWGRPENCTPGRVLSWVDVQNQVIETIGRDGEVLVMHIKGKGPHGYQVRVMEADRLDPQHNVDLRNGRRIVMGIELDQDDRPVNYHLRKTDHSGGVDVVPAGQILHLYIANRAGQHRGVPWMHTAIRRLNMLGKYEEAELVAARESAAKMGFFYSDSGNEYTGDDTDAEGNIITEAEPGQFEQLPTGVRFEAYDPTHPTNAFGDFVKSALRGVAAGLGVSYNSLASDLEGVNFSSIRSGVLEERDNWRALQQWLIAHLHEPVYRTWLATVIGSDLLPVPARRLAKFHAVTWQPRGWQWVDPLKDINAMKIANDMGVVSLTEIAASQGRDLEEVLAAIAAERDLAKQYGLTLNEVKTAMGATDANQKD